MMKREVLHETNVAGSDGGLANHPLCFLRRGRTHFRKKGIAPATAAQMANPDMAIVSQIRVAFIDRAKVNEVVFVFHLLPQNKYFHGFNF
jgi:hypothetical protein